MVSSVEMVLWAIHHATTLLFGVFASAALCGICLLYTSPSPRD